MAWRPKSAQGEVPGCTERASSATTRSAGRVLWRRCRTMDIKYQSDVTQLIPLVDKGPVVAGHVGRPRRRPDMLRPSSPIESTWSEPSAVACTESSTSRPSLMAALPAPASCHEAMRPT